MKKSFISILLIFFLTSAFAKNGKLTSNNMIRPPLLRMTEKGYRLIWNDNSKEKPEAVLIDENGEEKNLIVEEGVVEEKKSGWFVDLENLNPGKNYTVNLSSGQSINFQSPKSTTDKIYFVVMSDHQTFTDITEKGFNAVAEKNPDFIISCGDMQEDSKLKNWNENFFNKIPILSGIPFAGAMGNNDSHGSFYEDFFALEESYYTVIYGPARFIILNSNLSFKKDSDQLKWLEETLKNNSSPWTFVVYHHGSFVSTRPNQSNKNGRDALLNLFEKYKVDAVFNGHNHIYERTLPIQGTRFITIPSVSGFKPVFKVKEDSGYYCKMVQGINGFSTITIENNKMRFVVQDLDGTVLDEFEITKDFSSEQTEEIISEIEQ